MIKENGVKRPLMYAVIATLAIVLALPLALVSGQTKVGGLFDECYEDQCTMQTVYAEYKD